MDMPEKTYCTELMVSCLKETTDFRIDKSYATTDSLKVFYDCKLDDKKYEVTIKAVKQ